MFCKKKKKGFLLPLPPPQKNYVFQDSRSKSRLKIKKIKKKISPSKTKILWFKNIDKNIFKDDVLVPNFKQKGVVFLKIVD